MILINKNLITKKGNSIINKAIELAWLGKLFKGKLITQEEYYKIKKHIEISYE